MRHCLVWVFPPCNVKQPPHIWISKADANKEQEADPTHHRIKDWASEQPIQDLIQRVQSQQIEIYKLETEIHKIEDIRRQYEAL